MIPTTKSILLAQHAIKHAIDERTYHLPAHIKTQHWQAAKHAPNPWLSVREWYVGQPGWERAVADLLVELVLLSESKINLDTILTRRERQGEPDLTLAKVRRTP